MPSPTPWWKKPSTRFLGAPLLAGALALLAAALLRSPPAEGARGVRLEAGKPIDRSIRKGETHVYEVDVPAGRIVDGVIEQRGVDLMVRLIDPHGAAVATVDGPNGASGPEPWSLDGKSPGLWRLEVSPLESSMSGRYEARVDESITANVRDERLAKQRYPSPRLLRLWGERRAEGAAAVERFAKEM